MGRHKPLSTTRNIKYRWSQCVLVKVGSHDNSIEASERALDKGLSSHHPGSEGPKGMITEGIAPTLSYPCFSDYSVEAFLHPPLEVVTSEACEWQYSIGWRDLGYLANILLEARENNHCYFFIYLVQMFLYEESITLFPRSWSNYPLGHFREDGC